MKKGLGAYSFFVLWVTVIFYYTVRFILLQDPGINLTAACATPFGSNISDFNDLVEKDIANMRIYLQVLPTLLFVERKKNRKKCWNLNLSERYLTNGLTLWMLQYLMIVGYTLSEDSFRRKPCKVCTRSTKFRSDQEIAQLF